MARKADAKDDKQAKRVLEQLNTKTIRRPLASTGLTGDSLPDTTMSFDDYDRVINSIDASVANLEALNALKLVGDMAGFLPYGGPLRGTITVKTITGVDNAVNYLDFGPGTWSIEQIVVLYTGGSGTINFRTFMYDNINSGVPLEVTFGASTSSTTFVLNNGSQFDEFHNTFFGDTANKGTMLMGFKPNGTFTADSMTCYVVCHRVN